MLPVFYVLLFWITAANGQLPSTIPPVNYSYNGQVTLTDDQQYAVVAIRMTISFLSIFGSLFIISSIILLKKYHQISARLLLGLTVSAFLDSFSNLLSIGIFKHEAQDAAACTAQGIIEQFAQLSSFGWITIIAINLYLVVVRGIETHDYEKYFHPAVWLFALVTTVIPFASPGSYGPAGLWCWIIWDYQAYRWVLFYVPLILMIITVVATYALIIIAIRRRVEDANDLAKEKVERLRTRLISYPAIFVCCWIFPIINRIYDAVMWDDSFFLYFMHGLSEPLFGLLNAVAYGLIDPEMRRVWYILFQKWGLCAPDLDSQITGDDHVTVVPNAEQMAVDKYEAESEREFTNQSEND